MLLQIRLLFSYTNWHRSDSGTERKAKYPLYESIGMKAFFALFLLLTIGACISGIMVCTLQKNAKEL